MVAIWREMCVRVRKYGFMANSLSRSNLGPNVVFETLELCIRRSRRVRPVVAVVVLCPCVRPVVRPIVVVRPLSIRPVVFRRRRCRPLSVRPVVRLFITYMTSRSIHHRIGANAP